MGGIEKPGKTEFGLILNTSSKPNTRQCPSKNNRGEVSKYIFLRRNETRNSQITDMKNTTFDVRCLNVDKCSIAVNRTYDVWKINPMLEVREKGYSRIVRSSNFDEIIEYWCV